VFSTVQVIAARYTGAGQVQLATEGRFGHGNAGAAHLIGDLGNQGQVVRFAGFTFVLGILI
jgi:hypothetical protein